MNAFSIFFQVAEDTGHLNVHTDTIDHVKKLVSRSRILKRHAIGFWTSKCRAQTFAEYSV